MVCDAPAHGVASALLAATTAEPVALLPLDAL